MSFATVFIALLCGFTPPSPAASHGATRDDRALESIPAIDSKDWSLAHARQLLDRAGFGGTPEQIEKLFALGPEGAVDCLLDAASGREPEQRFDAEILRKKLREMLPPGETPKGEVGQKLRRQLVLKDRSQFEEYREFWITQMETSADPLREKLALFWHGYFTSAQREVRDSYSMARQVELYRALGLSSFRELLQRASKEPAMIEYLNNDQNKKQSPNENFAREVMELFTMGPGHYTEDDIHEAARAFTGWQTREGEFVFSRGRHDFGKKQFLGRTGAFGGEEILDILLEQDATPRFVAKKLFEFFAYRDPSPDEIEPLARLLREHDYALRPALRALFLSKAFYSQDAVGALFKSPVEFCVSTVRRLDIEPPPPGVLVEACALLGQELLNPPNVKGWDGGESWISASTLLMRANVARALVFGDAAFVARGRKNKMDGERTKDNVASVGFKVMKDLRGWRPAIQVDKWIGDATDAHTAVTRLCDRLLAITPAPSTVDEFVRYAAPFGDEAFDPTQQDTRELLVEVVHMILCLPEYQLN